MMDYCMLLVFCNFLTLCLVCRADKVQLIGHFEPIVVIVGVDVILPCTLRNTVSTVNAVDETVEWQRLDLSPKEVHFYRNQDDDNKDIQNEIYKGRTSLFKDEMQNGNISLKLTNVKLSDAGNYSCFVPSLDKVQKAAVQLIIGAEGKPNISIVGVDYHQYGVVLQCEAAVRHFNPDVIWLDSDENILPAGPTETQTDSDGRYTVRGEVTVQKTRNNTFTCRVTQQQINHTMETQIHVPDPMFPEPRSEPVQSWMSSWWFGGLMVFFVAAGVHLILTWRGLLHWGKGILMRNPDQNGDLHPNHHSLQNGILPQNGNIQLNGNEQKTFLHDNDV